MSGRGGAVPRIVLAVGAAILIVAFAVGGSRPAVRLAGSNGVGDGEFVAVLGPGETLCQPATVPGGTGRLRMLIGTYGRPGPELTTTVRARGLRSLLPVGRLAAGWRQGTIELPLGAAAPDTLDGVRVCIDNRGDARVAVAGTRTSRVDAARVAARPARGRVRFAYVEARRTSAWSLADRIASRSTFARGLWDGLAPWVALALVALACAAAARALLSAGERA